MLLRVQREDADEANEIMIERVLGGWTRDEMYGYARSSTLPRRREPAPPSDAELRRAREHAAGPPPRCEDYADDARFRAVRAAWYKAFTGVPLAGSSEADPHGQVDIAKQNDAFDLIARRFRAYTDGRAAR
ncbi:hypothetical protein OAO87_03565 [bacterium]|nr:hypothetical protein [bacterium]